MRNNYSNKNGNEFTKNETTSTIHSINESIKKRSQNQLNFLKLNNSKFDSSESSSDYPTYKKFSYLTDQNKNQLVNYLDPIANYKNYSYNQNHTISPVLCNSGTLSFQKSEIFFNKTPQQIQSVKNDSRQLSHQIIPNRLNVEGNNKYFRNNVLIEHSNNESNDAYFKHVTKISNDSPDWFKLNDRSKRDNINNYYVQNNQSLHVLSRFQDWITVTPKSKNRRKPLEKEKLTSLENSKICPIWMQINPKTEIPQDIFKPIQFTSFSDNIKKTILVDKNQKY